MSNTAKINQQIYNLMLNYFGGNHDKTWLWIRTRNPSLGGVTPLEMMKAGRSSKLLLFVQNNLSGMRL